MCGHFSSLGDEILKEVKRWAKLDLRMSKWMVSHDGLAGSHIAPLVPLAGAAAVAPAATRNLVAELEKSLEEVKGWKSVEELFATS